MNTSSWSIKKKMGSTMTVVISVMVLMGAMIGLSFFKFNSGVSRLEKGVDEMNAVKDLQLQVSNIWQYLTDASLVQDGEGLKEAKKSWKKLIKILPF
ncbi:MAG: hypothetical protein IPJ69_13700 [Deltaproteobacteria bacterium]|nr:MAG: hypothetical protein IPJ69_13700 [Deltaproteobacteria bacterium]